MPFWTKNTVDKRNYEMRFSKVGRYYHECSDRGNTFKIFNKKGGIFTLTKQGDYNQLIFSQDYGSLKESKDAARERRYEWRR